MSRLAPIAPVATALALHCGPALSSDAALLGCWKGESVTQFLADGTKGSTSGSCILEFAQGRIHSRCDGPQGPSEIKYSYQVVRPGVYSATLIAHQFRPDLIGGTREYEYRIEGEHLSLTTYPQTTRPTPPTAAVRVESRSVKVPCP